MSLPNVPMLNCDSWTMLLNHINFILKEYYLVLKYSSYKWAILGTETNASQTEFVHSDVNIVVHKSWDGLINKVKVSILLLFIK